MKFLLIIFILLIFSASKVNAAELQGNASWYSRAGCYKCSKSLRMANGQPLDDNKLTIALSPENVRRYSLMNKFVGVINVTTKKSVIAKVTDTGGFARYNRVADLGIAVKNSLGCKSICQVIITF